MAHKGLPNAHVPLRLRPLHAQNTVRSKANDKHLPRFKILLEFSCDQSLPLNRFEGAYIKLHGA